MCSSDLLTACGYPLGVAAAWPVELAARAVWPWPFPYFNVLQHGPTAMGALVCGGVLGWVQARAFRLLVRGPSPRGWAIATTVGWLTPLHLGAALAQWVVLRRYVRFGGWWVGAGWLTVVTAEMLAVKSGLGYMILNGQLTFRSDLIIAGIIVIGGIGLLADQLVRLVRARVCRWQEGLTASPI